MRQSLDVVLGEVPAALLTIRTPSRIAAHWECATIAFRRRDEFRLRSYNCILSPLVYSLVR